MSIKLQWDRKWVVFFFRMSTKYDHLCIKCHFERGDETSSSYHQRQYLKLLVDYVCPENVTGMSTQIQQQTHEHSKTTSKAPAFFLTKKINRILRVYLFSSYWRTEERLPENKHARTWHAKSSGGSCPRPYVAIRIATYGEGHRGHTHHWYTQCVSPL